MLSGVHAGEPGGPHPRHGGKISKRDPARRRHRRAAGRARRARVRGGGSFGQLTPSCIVQLRPRDAHRLRSRDRPDPGRSRGRCHSWRHRVQPGERPETTPSAATAAQHVLASAARRRDAPRVIALDPALGAAVEPNAYTSPRWSTGERRRVVPVRRLGCFYRQSSDSGDGDHRGGVPGRAPARRGRASPYEELAELAAREVPRLPVAPAAGTLPVVPATYRVTRYGPGEPSDRAYRPVILVYATLDPKPGTSRYFVTATLQPDVPDSMRRDLLVSLASLSPTGTSRRSTFRRIRSSRRRHLRLGRAGRRRDAPGLAGLERIPGQRLDGPAARRLSEGARRALGIERQRELRARRRDEAAVAGGAGHPGRRAVGGRPAGGRAPGSERHRHEPDPTGGRRRRRRGRARVATKRPPVGGASGRARRARSTRASPSRTPGRRGRSPGRRRSRSWRCSRRTSPRR